MLILSYLGNSLLRRRAALTCLVRAMSRIVEKMNNLQHIYGRDVTNLDNGNLFVPELDPIPKLANSKVAVTFQSVSFKRLFSKKKSIRSFDVYFGISRFPNHTLQEALRNHTIFTIEVVQKRFHCHIYNNNMLDDSDYNSYQIIIHTFQIHHLLFVYAIYMH